MSSENVRQFIHKVQNDGALRAKVETIPKDVVGGTITAIVKIGNAAGFAFTADDYTLAVHELLEQKHAAGQLNEEELALVAGGMRTPCLVISHCGPSK